MLAQFSNIITLLAHDVDLNDKWKIFSMLSYSQEVANSHTHNLGCSRDILMQKYKTCYVLTRMRVEMNSYPKSYDKIKLTTWAENKGKAIFTRYFVFDSENGTNLGNAVSQWVLMNTETRSIVRPSDLNIVTPDTNDLVPPILMPKKFFVEDESDFTIVKSPAYSDFDYNGHVNNARYAEWVCDLFPVEKFSNNSLQIIDIKFVKEIRSGDTVTLNLNSKKDEPIFFVKGKDPSNATFFECYGKWIT